MKSKKDYSILKQPISKDNITRISELIVLKTIKTHCGYDHKFDKLYKGLLCDMFDKRGFTITICKACFKIVDQYAWIQTRDDRIYCELDELIEYNTVPEVFYDTEVAYDNAKNLINAMNLSTDEEQTLRLLCNKLNLHQITEKLDICFQTVYLRRKRIQNKYLELKI